MRSNVILLILILALSASGLFAQKKKNEIIHDSIVDSRDGKVYKMVKIGDKTWMAENLKWECEGSCIYEGVAKNLKKYGRLYTFDASRNACPAGSHLPTTQEWDSLGKVVDPKESGEAGDKLIKKTYPGFSATLGGFMNAKGKFLSLEGESYYWGTDNTAYLVGDMKGGVTFFINDNLAKKDYKNSYSIRCVKD
jgi:uncharacterized protein (TIGR02145 family)